MQLAQDSSVDLPCSQFADQLVSFNPAGTEGGSDMGLLALGEPDEQSVDLATNSVLTVAFVGLGGIVDETGDDLRVHGSVSGQVAVYVGFGDGDMEFSGSLDSESLNVDISTATARTVTYIQLVGIEGSSTIDAFESLQTACTN